MNTAPGMEHYPHIPQWIWHYFHCKGDLPINLGTSYHFTRLAERKTQPRSSASTLEAGNVTEDMGSLKPPIDMICIQAA
jgi:hypothetical protein